MPEPRDPNPEQPEAWREFSLWSSDDHIDPGAPAWAVAQWKRWRDENRKHIQKPEGDE